MILSISQLAAWRRGQHGAVSATNGCFDVLHAGHVYCLHKAADYGRLVVGVNSDRAVRLLKGDQRPINPEYNRAFIIDSLKPVAVTVIFDDVCAADFLRVCHPDAWIKGGDYGLDTINPRERAVLEECGAGIHFVRAVHEISTTRIIDQMESECQTH